MVNAIITDEEFEALKGALHPCWPQFEKVAAAMKRIQDTFDSYEPRMVEQARHEYNRDGEIEIDDGAVCSRGEDHGCYVMAWVWVEDEYVCDRCGDYPDKNNPDTYGTVGDGFGGLCPSCADEAEEEEEDDE